MRKIAYLPPFSLLYHKLAYMSMDGAIAANLLISGQKERYGRFE